MSRCLEFTGWFRQAGSDPFSSSKKLVINPSPTGTLPSMTSNQTEQVLSKVPQITVGFWALKILATTLGETGGDALSMSLNLGYLLSTGIFAVMFAIAVLIQIVAKKFHPVIYWVTIIATTTVGTTLADFCDRSLGIGYTGGSALLLGLLLASLFIWKKTLGTVAVETISTPKAEFFYWVTIMCSQTLGTALGDWTSDSMELGYLASAAIFGGVLVLLALAYWKTTISRTILFWAAFILTRPLGAVVGDFLDKPHDHGGLALSRFTASAVLLTIMVVIMVAVPQRAAAKDH
jgi:uncharacterized membrane-anchored protein